MSLPVLLYLEVLPGQRPDESGGTLFVLGSPDVYLGDSARHKSLTMQVGLSYTYRYCKQLGLLCHTVQDGSSANVTGLSKYIFLLSGLLLY